MLPLQCFPPFMGEGAWHSRLLQWVHSVPQADHFAHSVQPPSTGRTAGKCNFMWSFLSICCDLVEEFRQPAALQTSCFAVELLWHTKTAWVVDSDKMMQLDVCCISSRNTQEDIVYLDRVSYRWLSALGGRRRTLLHSEGWDWCSCECGAASPAHSEHYTPTTRSKKTSLHLLKQRHVHLGDERNSQHCCSGKFLMLMTAELFLMSC